MQCFVKLGAFILYSLSFHLADLNWPKEQYTVGSEKPPRLDLLDICGLDLHWFVLGNCCGSNLFSHLHRSGRSQASATQASYWKRIGRFWNQVQLLSKYWTPKYREHLNTGLFVSRSLLILFSYTWWICFAKLNEWFWQN